VLLGYKRCQQTSCEQDQEQLPGKPHARYGGRCHARCGRRDDQRRLLISAGLMGCLQATQTRTAGPSNCPQAGHVKGWLGNALPEGEASLSGSSLPNSGKPFSSTMYDPIAP
jgi:hypothetical protein